MACCIDCTFAQCNRVYRKVMLSDISCVQYHLCPSVYQSPTQYHLKYEDCPEGTVRYNNYFKECWGLAYMCRNSCYNYILDHHEGVGP